MTTPFSQPHYTMLSLLIALLKWVRESPLRNLSILSGYELIHLKKPSIQASALEKVFKVPAKQLDLPDTHMNNLESRIEEKGLNAVLKELIESLEHTRSELSEPELPLDKNLTHLQQALDLSSIETDLLALSILINTHDQIDTLANKIDSDIINNFRSFLHLLSLVLAQPLEALQQVLKPQSKLLQSGLIKLDLENYAFNNNSLDNIIEILPGLNRLVYEPFVNVENLMSIWFKSLTPSLLTEKDFPHLQDTIEDVCAYLNLQIKQQRTGLNVLLYGPPGTGKTELSTLLSHSAGLKPYGVKTSTNDVPMTRAQRRSSEHTGRFQAYRLGQHMLQNQPNAVLVFDEAEDVFSQGSDSLLDLFMPRIPKSDGRKAWVNEQLETNPVPTIWLTNRIQQIDPAYMRRYDFLVEVPVPPKSVRKRIIQHHWKEFSPSETMIEKLATYSDIPPAIYAKAAKVIKALNLTGDRMQNSLLRQINDWRRVSNLPPVQLNSAQREHLYDIKLINAEPGAPFILRMLQHAYQARLCFYGMPGTGKTAFANHLAEQLDKPLMQKRVSDIVSPYVGQTEQNLAQLFLEAEREQAVLFLDEGDSFLRDRTLAHHSWEVTQTNELLTQMENFQGIFILATNLMDNLDPAAMRRFDFRLHFKPLTAEQSWRLFKILVPEADPRYQEKLKPLTLAHGHYATVNRQIKLANINPDGDFILQLLKAQLQELKVF